MRLLLQGLFVMWLTSLLASETGATTTSYHNKSADDEADRANVVLLAQASELLASIGVTELCHPHRDDLTGFQRCSMMTIYSARDHGNNERIVTKDESGKRFLNEDDNSNNDEEYHYYPPIKSNWFYARNILGAVICVSLGALASGLTIGLLSLDPLLLHIKSTASKIEEEQKQAAALLPLVRQHHLLLVTLLLLNTAAGEALPLFLHDLMPEILVVLVAVVLVLFCGEILPSAIFTGSHQIPMAARFAPIVKGLMWLLYPITYPIACLLDRLVYGSDNISTDHDGGGGVHDYAGNVLHRGELAALIRIQYETATAAKLKRKQALHNESVLHLDGNDAEMMMDTVSATRSLYSSQNHHRRTSSIHCDEITMVEGALQMKTKAAVDLLVSFHKVFSASMDAVLDEKRIFRIFSSGYSRVPVYEGDCKTRIKGILMTRQLILVNASDERTISQLPLHVPQCVAPDTNLVDLVNLFQAGGNAQRAGHMALVCARPDIANRAFENDQPLPEEAGWMGIITLEDVLEALIQEQIYDEMDAAGRVNKTESEDNGDVNSYHLVV